MSKRKCECTTEEWERQKAMSRERNRRYLSKQDPDVKARRDAAHKAYLSRLANDPDYAEQNAARKRRAIDRTAEWQKANPEKVKEHAKASRGRNPDREAAKVQRRNAAKLQAIPSWANREAIDRHYANARYLSKATGHQHHVDHVIPLRGDTVCGLHVEYNMRVVPHFINTRKGNKLVGA